VAGTSRGFIYNSEIVGAYAFATDDVCFLPKGIDNKIKKLFIETLETEIVEINISNSPLIGVFIVANENGALLPWTSTKEEIEILKSYFKNVEILQSKYNALGNLISVNSYGAILHISFDKEEIETVKNTLKIKKLAYLNKGKPLASYIFVDNNGFLASPCFDDNDLKLFEEVFSVKGDIGTVNRGSNIIKLGIIKNNKGIIVGGLTTGAEIAKIEQILGFAKKPK
jgi:translation initiation factor eIF-6, putative